MPIHDWSGVPDGTFHHFHVTWIPLLARVLNRGVLPEGYYAMAEQVAGGIIPDILTLQEASRGQEDGGATAGPALALEPPQVSITASLDRSVYLEKVNRLVVRHQSHDQTVAIVEVVSPGNKASATQLKKFVDKAIEALGDWIHLLIIDLHAPSRRDPQGIHGVIWQELGAAEPYMAPPGKPLTLASYEADLPIRAYVEPLAPGDVLRSMPLFLAPSRYVQVPLEESYMAAVADIPEPARRALR